MSVLFAAKIEDPDGWIGALRARLPDEELRIWPDAGPADAIEVALIAGKPELDLRPFPNLRLICSLWAGVESLLGDPRIPERVPLARMVDQKGLTAGMTEYVLLTVLRYHRELLAYERAQRERTWLKLPLARTSRRRIGIMGLGVLGQDAGAKLAALGFPVAGWSRTPKAVPEVESFAGDAMLPAFLARTDILVCLLPLTPATKGILNRHTLSLLPRGACVINAARGGHVVDADLLGALDSGQIAHATLDVFNEEPLPPEHPFWTHPAVTVTPHIASVTEPESAAARVAENIRRLRAGAPLLDLVDRRAGY